MQHHGAPTRLLDCSYSIYVAAYFALEYADSDCAVWAVNAPWALRTSVSNYTRIGKSSAKTLQAKTTEARETAAEELLFLEPFARAAFPSTPFRLNERLRTQRATFLIPGDVTVGFTENLFALDGHDDRNHVIKIVVPFAMRVDALEQLYSMNISRHSLFPGLDGFAQSLGVFHPSFRPVNWD